MRSFKAVCCVGVLAAVTVMAAPGIHADEWDKKTILTFSGPVQIPGATLQAGSYVFKLADLSGNRHVVRVFDKDEKKIISTMMAMPNQRLTPSDKPVVLFSERPSGSPQAIRVWYYPGDTIGNEFVYPKRQAMAIAKANHQPVLATNDEPAGNTTDAERMASMKTATVGHFNEDGAWASEDRTIATSNSSATVSTPANTNTAAAASPSPTMAANNATVGTSG